MQIHFNYFGRGYHRLKMKYTPVYYIVLEKKNTFNVLCDYYTDFQLYLILVFAFGYFTFITEINSPTPDTTNGTGTFKKFLI